MATFLLVVTSLFVAGLLALAHARATARTYQDRLTDLVKVTELTQAVSEAADVLGRLATGPSPDRTLNELNQIRDRIYRLRQELPTATASPASARLLADLDAVADSFLIESGAAAYAFLGNDLERYFQHDREASLTAGYLRDVADRLLASEVEAYREVYPQVMRREWTLQNLNFLVLLSVTALALILSWWFARDVAEPLRVLAAAAGRISAGDLDGPPVQIQSTEELQVLGQAFNQMQDSLRRRMAELNEKVLLERRLQVQEMERLRMETLLREAELRALQSQVNPHFLFNTLNMVAKMAMLEGADRTCSLLETVSDLMRYSLGKLDQPVTLAEEVEQVRRYATIQSERFRGRFAFRFEVDHSALGLHVPCMTLQPLVENAVIHGIGNREEGGTVTIRVRSLGDTVRVEVEDDGVGIPPDKLAVLNAGAGASGVIRGHTTGLGLQNVRERLQMFWSRPVSLVVESQVGRGTRVTLDLPANREGGEPVADLGG